MESTGSGADAAEITITGTGGAGTNVNQGVAITGTDSKVTSADGNISINGTGGAGSNNNYFGVLLGGGGQVVSTGTGAGAAEIAITGTGGAGTAFNHGVFILDTNSKVTSADGDISITGTPAGASGDGLRLENDGTVESTGTADITVTTDSLNIVTAGTPGTVAGGTNTVTVQPKTGGGAIGIDLGTNAVAANTLEIDDAELDRITAGTLIIGSATAGAVDVSAPISPGGTSLLHLISSSTVGDGGAGTITETDLAVEAGGTVTLTNSHAISGKVAMSTSSGNIDFTNTPAVEVGTVDGVSGLATEASDITMANTGTVTISQAVNTPAPVLPHWPLPLSPQQYRSGPMIAHPWAFPIAKRVARPGRITGMVGSERTSDTPVVPVPSEPRKFSPQQNT